MTPRRIERFKQVLNKKQRDLTIILENVHDSHNIGAVLRTCDAVGVRELYIVHTDSIRYCKVGKGNPMGKKTSGRILKWMEWHAFDSIEACFEVVRQKYDHIYTTHMDKTAVDLYDLDFTQSVALVFGNERDGVSEKAVEMADGNFMIPQVGMAQSLNVSVACAVTLYEAHRQRKSAGLYNEPSLNASTRQNIFNQWIEREALIAQRRKQKSKTTD